MAYTNQKVEIAFTSQPDALVQNYTDVTADVDGQIEIVAGATPNGADPANTCEFKLRNIDQRYTPGNLLSATALKSARRVRVTETIADQVVELFAGYVRFPTIDQWTESTPAEPRDQTLTVTAVDQLVRLAEDKTFVSVLAEHIVYTGGAGLKGFWPMTEPQLPFAGIGPTAAALDMRPSRSGTTGLTVAVQPQAGLAPDGGEAGAARMVTAGAGTSGHAFVWTFLPSTFAPAIGASDAVVVVFWWAFPPSMAQNDSSYRQIVSFNGPTAALALEMSSSSRQWVLTASGLTGSISGGFVGDQQLLPIGVYLKESTGAMELWTGSVRQTTTLAGVPAGAGTFSWGGMGFQCDYDVSHLQVYVGSSFGYSDFLTQIQQGYAPLDKQSTGQRINTIMDYAGVPRGDAFRDINPGVAVMSTAELAGLSPKDAIDAAVETEQGRFYISGGGRATFADRIRIYNV